MAEGRVSYAGYKVIDVVLHNEREREFLQSLPEDRGEVRGIDVWTNEGILIADGETVNRVLLSPAGYKAMVNSGLFDHAKVITDDMEKRIAEVRALDAKHEIQRNLRANVYDPADGWYYHWHSYDEIQERLQAIARSFHMIDYFTIGQSHEGRKIGMLHIKGRSPSRTIAFIAGTHAREWMAEGVILWALGCITEQYDKDKNLTAIIDSLDLYICPCYNPDGYTYTRNYDMLWRKNRRDNGDGSFGVDQNRNWDVDWGHSYSSHDPSSIIYCGPSALSEPEVIAMHDFLHSFSNMTAVIDFHSPMNAFMRPYAYKNETSPDEDKLQKLGYNFIQQVYSVHGTKYKNVRSAQTYIDSGTCVDAAYLLGSHIAYTLELLGPDFVLPESEIQKQGEEIFAGLRYFLEVAGTV